MSLTLAPKCYVLFCLLSIGLAGFGILADYSSRPGPESYVLESITDTDLPGVQRDPNAPTIVLFYHPKCPCTFATIRCLARLRTSFRSQPNVHAFALLPKSESDDWIDTRSTRALRQQRRTWIHPDVDGKTCRRFGVVVSGHILVYDRDGQLTFSGGITPYRGHEGACRASTHFVRCVNEEPVGQSRWPVFGCLVVDPDEASAR